MKIAIFIAPIIKILIIIFYVFSYPLSIFLDWYFGTHESKKRFNRRDLKTLVELHKEKNTNEGNKYLN